MKKCINCGTTYENDAKFCQECGGILEEKVLCPNCREPLPSSTAKFCSNCGTKTDGSSVSSGHLGDHNVIAGNVSNFVHNTTTTTQNIINQNDAQTTLSCAICGKIITKGSGNLYNCGSCHKTVCVSCFDAEKNKCKKCVDQEKDDAYSAKFCAFDFVRKRNGKYEIKKLIDKGTYIIDIPDKVESIADGAFEGSSVARITLPDGVVSIGCAAFKNCKSLRSINIPDSVFFIKDEAFYGCDKLKLDIPKDVELGADAIFGTINYQKASIIEEYERKAVEEADRKK